MALCTGDAPLGPLTPSAIGGGYQRTSAQTLPAEWVQAKQWMNATTWRHGWHEWPKCWKRSKRLTAAFFLH